MGADVMNHPLHAASPARSFRLALSLKDLHLGWEIDMNAISILGIDIAKNTFQLHRHLRRLR